MVRIWVVTFVLPTMAAETQIFVNVYQVLELANEILKMPQLSR